MKIEIKSTPHRKIPVVDILPNPHRDLKLNPINETRVDELLDSIDRTGFWDNIVVREHPTRDGKYQLAYGHNRLAALKHKTVSVDTITIPVAKLSDWQMYCAMVEENELQGAITPAIAFENIGKGCDLIEAAFKKIGPDGTFEKFAAEIGRDVSTDTTRTLKDHGFEQVRNDYFAGEGLGRVFLVEYLPCGKMRSNTISTVLEERYGESRRKAREARAKEKEKEALAKRKAAAKEQDEKKRAKMQADADKDEAEAKKLNEAAQKINFIDRKILMLFDTPNFMTDFAEAIKQLKIPAKHHKASAELVLKANVRHERIKHELDIWWDQASGEAEKRRKSAERERQRKKAEEEMKGQNFRVYLHTIYDDLRASDMSKRLRIAIDNINIAEEAERRIIIEKIAPLVSLLNELVQRERETRSGLKNVTPAKMLIASERK